MAFSEFESKKYEMVTRKFIDALRPPAHRRNQIDLSCRVSGQSVEIFELVRSSNEEDRMIEEAVAKATYVKAARVWKLYWQRADLRWHRYDPFPEVESLEQALQVVCTDEYACFFG